MIVERGDLVDLGLRQPHLLGQRPQMACGEAAIFVLDQMQEFDEQVGSARLGAEKSLDFSQSAVIEWSTLGAAIAAAPLLNFHSLSQCALSQTRLE
jgi:hypothetical protein